MLGSCLGLSGSPRARHKKPRGVWKDPVRRCVHNHRDPHVGLPVTPEAPCRHGCYREIVAAPIEHTVHAYSQHRPLDYGSRMSWVVGADDRVPLVGAWVRWAVPPDEIAQDSAKAARDLAPLRVGHLKVEATSSHGRRSWLPGNLNQVVLTR